MDDIRKAVIYLRKLEFVDTARTAAMGGSGGGTASSLLGLEEYPEKVKCVVDQFGPTDFTDTQLRNIPIWRDRLIPKIFGDVSYEATPQIYRKALPVYHVSANDKDFLDKSFPTWKVEEGFAVIFVIITSAYAWPQV